MATTFGTITIETRAATPTYQTVKFQSTKTFNCTSFVADGASGRLITIGSTTTSAHTLSDSAGTNTVTYCEISYSTATGGATWNSFISSGNENDGNNTGWDFGAISLTLGSITHSHTIDAISVSEYQWLNVSSLSSDHLIASAGLNQYQGLSVSSASHTHSISQASLSQYMGLAVSSLTQEHLISAIVLSQYLGLNVVSLSQEHLASSAQIWQRQFLNITELNHAHLIDAITVSQSGIFSVTISSLIHTHSIAAINAALLGLHGRQPSVHHIAKRKAFSKSDVVSIQSKKHEMRIHKT